MAGQKATIPKYGGARKTVGPHPDTATQLLGRKTMSKSWDYIIVGAGSAGCVLANRLSEDPNIRVLLLEAGSRDWNPFIHMPGGLGKLFGPGVNWRFRTVPQKHLDNREVWYPQGKTLGGSSSINAMIYIRCQAEDYDGWEALGNKGWSYKDVLPYFRKAEDNDRFANEYHGQGGPLWVSDQSTPHPLSRAFVRAMQQYGMPYNPDFNGKSMEGAGFYQVTARRGVRRSAAVSYLRPAAGRKNLVVWTRAQVNRINFEGDRATSLDVVHDGDLATLRAEHEIIVSSGALNSPKLLMLSGIGDPDELKAVGVTPKVELRGVGKNLHDHLCTNVHMSTRGHISYDGHDKLPWSALHGLQWLLYRSGPVASVIVEGGGFVTSPGESRPDLQIHLAPATVVRGGQTKIPGHGFTVNSTFLRPRSRGTLKLRSSDPGDMPLIDPNYLADPVDARKAIESVRRIRDILSQPAIAPLIEDERLPGTKAETDEQILAYVRQFGCCDYHPVGTCKMGNDDLAVVDSHLKVRGVSGLRVVDSSVMPVLPSGNTNAPTIMIAEKAADFILGRQTLRAEVPQEIHG